MLFKCKEQAHEAEDTAALASALAQLVPLGGLGIQASIVRDRLGFPDPEPGAELLGQGDGTAETGTAESRARCQCGPCHQAINRGQDTADELEVLAAEELDDWQEQMAPIVNPVLELADTAGGYEAFLEALPSVLGEMDATHIIEHLAEATFKARGMGDATDEV